MDGKLILVVFSLVGSAFSDTVLVNEAMDKTLKAFAERSAAQGFNFYSVPDFQGFGADLKGITVGDLTTIHRVGDAYYSRNVADEVFEGGIAFDLLVDKVKEFTIDGKTFEAKFVSTGNTFSMRARITRFRGHCITDWEHFQIDTFGTVKMFATEPKYNGIDVTDVFQHKVIQYLNKTYQSKKFKEFMRKNVDLCIE